MPTFGQITTRRRTENADALACFGMQVSENSPENRYRHVREGNGTSIFTIGYERRDGDDLFANLIDAGVDLLVDIRKRPMSRKPDFRGASLREQSNLTGVEYQSWPQLGSTAHQRNKLKETGDIGEFRRRFRDFARRRRAGAIDDLSLVAKSRTIALLCYERIHEECHRSIVADLVADRLNATVIAIV